MDKKVRLLDVAQKAGVPYSTASMALSGKGRVSQEVRNRVIEASQELGYKKNVEYSQSLTRNYTECVSILLHLDQSWIPVWGIIDPILLEIERVLYIDRYNPVIIPVSDSTDENSIFEKVINIGAKAVFSIWDVIPNLFKRFEINDIPVIIINNDEAQEIFHTVCVDNFQGTYAAAAYLLRLGHKMIRYLEYYREDAQKLVDDRFMGYRKALEEKKNEYYIPERRYFCDIDNPDSIRALVGEMFSDKNNVPDGLVIHDDLLALRVYEHLLELNIEVPGDVSLISHGDVYDYSQPFIPQLTTMKAESLLIGEVAANLMRNILTKKTTRPEALKLIPKLIERNSCIDRN